MCVNLHVSNGCFGGVFYELAVSRRKERTKGQLSWRERPLASDRCFCSEMVFRCIVCLPRRPWSKFLMNPRTPGKQHWRFSGRAFSSRQVSWMFRRSSGIDCSSLKKGGGRGFTNPPTNPLSSDPTINGRRGGESMPCTDGPRLDEVMVLGEEPDTRGASRLFRWRLFCELAVSRWEERTGDRLS